METHEDIGTKSLNNDMLFFYLARKVSPYEAEIDSRDGFRSIEEVFLFPIGNRKKESFRNGFFG